MVGPGQCEASREFGWKGDGGHLEKYADAHWKEHLGYARAAIEAMREPTEEMVDAVVADSPIFEMTEGQAKLVFESMIDAALSTSRSSALPPQPQPPCTASVPSP